jgi:hypothetical protein
MLYNQFRIMKILWAAGVSLVVLSACNEGTSINIHVDSAGKKVDSTAQRVWDTAKTALKKTGAEIVEKAKDVKVEVNARIGSKKDSTKKD